MFDWKKTKADTKSFLKKAVLNDISIFTRKRLCSRLKVEGLKVCYFIKKRLHHKCFPVNIDKFLRMLILKNIGEWLLLIKRNCSEWNMIFSELQLSLCREQEVLSICFFSQNYFVNCFLIWWTKNVARVFLKANYCNYCKTVVPKRPRGYLQGLTLYKIKTT